jgi:alpha-N-arabinofuranosidase
LNDNLDGAPPKLFYSVTRKSDDGTVYLKLVNASSVPQPLHIQLHGTKAIDKDGKLIAMSAKTTAATHSISQLSRLCRWKVGSTMQRPSSRTRFPAIPSRFWS